MRDPLRGAETNGVIFPQVVHRLIPRDAELNLEAPSVAPQ
jgi:hypothetical protein